MGGSLGSEFVTGLGYSVVMLDGKDDGKLGG